MKPRILRILGAEYCTYLLGLLGDIVCHMTGDGPAPCILLRRRVGNDVESYQANLWMVVCVCVCVGRGGDGVCGCGWGGGVGAWGRLCKERE